MALTVTVRTGNLQAPPHVTFDAPRIVIGRGEGCEVRLPDPSVSHRHASIRQRGTDYIVVDEGSTNGTFVGPVRLSPQAPRVLRSGDLIRVGRIWLEVKIEHVVPTANTPVATKEIALALVAQALSAQGEASGARVRVVEGPDAGRELLVDESGRTYVVGRGQGIDLALDDADASRRHLEIVRRGDQLQVRDLGSKNGSRIGERPLVSGRDTAWRPGEVLGIGADRIVYDDPVSDALEELERAADERMREDESVDPPDTDEAASDEPPDATPVGEIGVDDGGRDGPIAAIPGPAPRAAKRPRGAWGATDLMVAALALLVLALSVFGLWWMFRTN